MEDNARICRVSTCASNGAPQPIENFPSNGDGKEGRRWQCNDCMKKRNRQWRQNNKEKVLEYNKTSRPKI